MAAKTGKKKRAPLRRAERFAADLPGTAGRLLVIMIVMIVMCLIFSALQSLGADWLRVVISAIIVLGVLLFLYSEGLNKGARDAASSRFAQKQLEKGNAIGAREDAICYHPLKALAACAMVFGLPLLLALFIAATAEEYTYTLQDLPTWLTSSYGARQDVVGPLGAYMQTASGTVRDWLRVIVRLLELIFVNFFPDPQRMSAMIDRLSPLFLLTYPLAYMVGYLRGPAADAKLQAQNKKAKKAAVRKQKKSNLASELVGDAKTPHYGHQREEDKPKRKELI